MLVARKASCCVANSFSTVLKLIWPRSSLKSTKMSKKHIFCKKFQVGVNGLKLVLINIPNHDLWICTYQPSTKKDSKHKVLIQAEFLWSESTKIKSREKITIQRQLITFCGWCAWRHLQCMVECQSISLIDLHSTLHQHLINILINMWLTLIKCQSIYSRMLTNSYV